MSSVIAETKTSETGQGSKASEPMAQVFDLKTQLLSGGKLTDVKCRTDMMTVAMKCHAEGGENSLHAHVREDHVFVVLQGEATFHIGRDEQEVVLHAHQGMLIPRGAYYRFESTGKENLVQLRVGAGVGGADLMNHRKDVRGEDLDPHSAADHYADPVPLPGRFFS